MEDAYVIGIRLALDNGVSAGVSAIRDDLLKLDRAIATSTERLRQLQTVASSTTAVALGQIPAPHAPEQKPLALAEPQNPQATPPGTRQSNDAPWPPPSDERQSINIPMPRAQTMPMQSEAVGPVLAMPNRASPPSPKVEAISSDMRASPERDIAPAERSAHQSDQKSLSPISSPTPASVVAQFQIASLMPSITSPRQPKAVPVLSTPAATPAFSLSAPPPREPAIVPVHSAAEIPRQTLAARDLSLPATAPIASLPTGGGHPTPPIGRLGASPPVGAPSPSPPTVMPLAPQPPRTPTAPARMIAAPIPPPVPTAPPATLPQAAPHAPSPTTGPTGGDVFLDGTRLGHWIATSLARSAGRPPSGTTGFDPRLGVTWPGTQNGGG